MYVIFFADDKRWYQQNTENEKLILRFCMISDENSQ